MLRKFYSVYKNQRWVYRRYSDIPKQVILLSFRDVFVCKVRLGHNVLEEAEKFCYLGNIICCYDGA